MAKPGTILGWKLPPEQRAALLDQFPPKYGNVVADHVTLLVGADQSMALPPEVEARIVVRADDGDSLECLVVALDGSTDRPDGSTFHITWSLGPGRQARESNDVLRSKDWAVVDPALTVTLRPARF